MEVPSDTGAEVRLAYGDDPPIRDESASDRVVSVLFGTELESWRTGWNRTISGPPDREAVLDASDVARSGTAASTQIMPDGRLAYTVLGHSAGGDRVLGGVGDHLDGVPPGTVDLLVDDLALVAAREEVDSAAAFVDRLLKRFGGRARRIVIGCSSGAPAALISRVSGRFDAVVGTDAETAGIERLSRRDPTTFGYVRRHWAEAKRGIETCDRNYPQSRQVHAALTEPETTPRTLGATLSGLVTLGALDTWSETVGPTRYDLTAYRPKRTCAVGVALAATSGD